MKKVVKGKVFSINNRAHVTVPMGGRRSKNEKIKFGINEIEEKVSDFVKKEIEEFDTAKFCDQDREFFSIDVPPPTVSGSLHMGHVYSYVNMDCIARAQKLAGKTLFYPIGFDDNGLPTEQLFLKIAKQSIELIYKTAFSIFMPEKVEKEEIATKRKSFAEKWAPNFINKQTEPSEEPDSVDTEDEKKGPYFPFADMVLDLSQYKDSSIDIFDKIYIKLTSEYFEDRKDCPSNSNYGPFESKRFSIRNSIPALPAFLAALRAALIKFFLEKKTLKVDLDFIIEEIKRIIGDSNSYVYEMLQYLNFESLESFFSKLESGGNSNSGSDNDHIVNEIVKVVAGMKKFVVRTLFVTDVLSITFDAKEGQAIVINEDESAIEDKVKNKDLSIYLFYWLFPTIEGWGSILNNEKNKPVTDPKPLSGYKEYSEFLSACVSNIANSLVNNCLSDSYTLQNEMIFKDLPIFEDLESCRRQPSICRFMETKYCYKSNEDYFVKLFAQYSENLKTFFNSLILGFHTTFKDLFSSLGMGFDFNLSYSTISPKYQEIGRSVFLNLLNKGQIFESFDNLRPVYWDRGLQTPVSQSEIIENSTWGDFFYCNFRCSDGNKYEVATTRPEMLPACVAVLYNPKDERYASFDRNTNFYVPYFETKVPAIPDSGAIIEKGSGLVMLCTYGDFKDVEWMRKHQKEYNLKFVPIFSSHGELVPARCFDHIKERSNDSDSMVRVKLLLFSSWIKNLKKSDKLKNSLFCVEHFFSVAIAGIEDLYPNAFNGIKKAYDSRGEDPLSCSIYATMTLESKISKLLKDLDLGQFFCFSISDAAKSFVGDIDSLCKYIKKNFFNSDIKKKVQELLNQYIKDKFKTATERSKSKLSDPLLQHAGVSIAKLLLHCFINTYLAQLKNIDTDGCELVNIAEGEDSLHIISEKIIERESFVVDHSVMENLKRDEAALVQDASNKFAEIYKKALETYNESLSPDQLTTNKPITEKQIKHVADIASKKINKCLESFFASLKKSIDKNFEEKPLEAVDLAARLAELIDRCEASFATFICKKDEKLGFGFCNFLWTESILNFFMSLMSALLCEGSSEDVKVDGKVEDYEKHIRGIISQYSLLTEKYKPDQSNKFDYQKFMHLFVFRCALRANYDQSLLEQYEAEFMNNLYSLVREFVKDPLSCPANDIIAVLYSKIQDSQDPKMKEWLREIEETMKEGYFNSPNDINKFFSFCGGRYLKNSEPSSLFLISFLGIDEGLIEDHFIKETTEIYTAIEQLRRADSDQSIIQAIERALGRLKQRNFSPIKQLKQDLQDFINLLKTEQEPSQQIVAKAKEALGRCREYLRSEAPKTVGLLSTVLLKALIMIYLEQLPAFCSCFAKIEKISHSVKVSERSGERVELLPLRQWMLNVSDDDIVQQIHKCNDSLNWLPNSKKDIMNNWLNEPKMDWCISRDRKYGVKIPMAKVIVRCKDRLYCFRYIYDNNPDTITNDEIIGSIFNIVSDKVPNVFLPITPGGIGGRRREAKLSNCILRGIYSIEDDLVIEPNTEKNIGFFVDNNVSGIVEILNCVDLKPISEPIKIEKESEITVFVEAKVFDTWFISSLSPQASLGILNDKISTKLPGGNVMDSVSLEDRKRMFKNLFPFSLRSQAHEIIRTWAYYTIVQSAYNNKSRPWNNIMISGWCLSEGREKMSKSKGNIVDPVGLIKDFGADAIRYWSAKGRLGADIAYDENTINIGERLVKKIYNASKFISIFEFKETESVEHVCTTIDRAWLSILSRTLDSFEKTMIKEYEYSIFLTELEEVFYDYCDNYMELVKYRSYKNEGVTTATYNSAVCTLRISMKVFLALFSTFMPFISNHSYCNLFGSFVDVSFNDLRKLLLTESALSDFFAFVRKIIDYVRRLKSKMKVSIKKEFSCVKFRGIEFDDDKFGAFWRESIHDIKSILNCDSIEFVDDIQEDDDDVHHLGNGVSISAHSMSNC